MSQFTSTSFVVPDHTTNIHSKVGTGKSIVTTPSVTNGSSVVSRIHHGRGKINQAKLPQTGNDRGNVAALLATLPTMLTILALAAKRKKKREDE